MGRLSKEEQARNDGIVFALAIVQKYGIDGLKEEVKRRGLQSYSLNVPQKELDKVKQDVSGQVLRYILAVGCLKLHDLFGFGRDRCMRWLNAMDTFAECQGDARYEVDFDDVIQALHDELKIEIE